MMQEKPFKEAKKNQYGLLILQLSTVAIILLLLISSENLTWLQGLGFIILLCSPMLAFLIGLRQASQHMMTIIQDENISYIPSPQEVVDSLPIPALVSNIVDGVWQVNVYNTHLKKICSKSVENALQDQEYEPLRQINAQLVHLNVNDVWGNKCHLLCYSKPLSKSSKSDRLCVLIDITADENHRIAREDIQRAGVVSTIAASITHDFRNILTGMIGYAELLEMDIEDATQHEFINLILKSGEQASVIMDQMMQVSRAHSSEHELLDVRVPLNNAVQQIHLLLPNNVKLLTEIDKSVPVIKANSLQLEYCISQLLSNALQAINNKGNIRLLLFNDSKHALAQIGKPAIHIQVCDDGCGIAEADIDNIFNLFWSSFHKNDEQDSQSGLGLAIVKRIIRWHHGVVNVEKNIDMAGVIFNVILPAFKNIVIPDANINATNDDTIITKTITTNKLLAELEVLVVDDNEAVRKVHSSLFKRMGHIVSTAKDGVEALKMLDAQPKRFHIVATDFRMPNMDGLELIVNMGHHGHVIPTLMLTGFGEDTSLRCLDDLNVDLLVKPINYKILQKTINQLQQRTSSLQADK
ncbi:MAG: hybrid sensor histidine kinase/response regulator [Mariprofundales bacterium]